MRRRLEGYEAYKNEHGDCGIRMLPERFLTPEEAIAAVNAHVPTPLEWAKEATSPEGYDFWKGGHPRAMAHGRRLFAVLYGEKDADPNILEELGYDKYRDRYYVEPVIGDPIPDMNITQTFAESLRDCWPHHPGRKRWSETFDEASILIDKDSDIPQWMLLHWLLKSSSIGGIGFPPIRSGIAPSVQVLSQLLQNESVSASQIDQALWAAQAAMSVANDAIKSTPQVRQWAKAARLAAEAAVSAMEAVASRELNRQQSISSAVNAVIMMVWSAHDWPTAEEPAWWRLAKRGEWLVAREARAAPAFQKIADKLVEISLTG